VVFDTQLFRYVKSSSASHLMAAELLKFESAPEDVHRHLFATYTVEKLNFLMRALLKTEYREENRLAFVPVLTSDFEAGAFAHKARHETGDIVDQLMNIESIEMAALLRQDSPSSFKLSLRGRGTCEVLSIAESFGGGGHRFASGAYLQGTYEELRGQIIAAMENGLSKDSDAKKKQAP
jgi:phosphoesterase RecJ-like protein